MVLLRLTLNNQFLRPIVKGRILFSAQLFAIERQLSDCTTEERYKKRQELAKPVLDEFLSDLHTNKASTESSFGRAEHYTIEQWKYLERYRSDGRLDISNNRAE